MVDSALPSSSPKKPLPVSIDRAARPVGGRASSQATLIPLIEKEIEGIGMGVLSDGTPYLNQRGLAAICGVQNAHIGTISSQWDELDEKPRIKAIKEIIRKMGVEVPTSAHIELRHAGRVNYCYPQEVCLAVLEYYAFDAGVNCQPEARDNFRKLAGSKLRDLIYNQLGYDPTGQNRFAKWHERISLNYQSAPKGFFHVFNETSTIIYELICAGAKIDERFIVDISVGLHWSSFWLKENLGDRFGKRAKYPHRYPPDHPQAFSNPQDSWCYPVTALGEFRSWLQDQYIEGGKFQNYLQTKTKQGLLPPSIAEIAIKTMCQAQLPAA